MTSEFQNLSSYSKPSSPKKKAFLYVILFILLIGGAILAGNFFLGNHTQKEIVVKPTPTVAPTPTNAEATPTKSLSPTPKTTVSPTPNKKITPTPSGMKTPTPTEEPVASTKLRIEVLNGSGTSGEASKMASFLKSKGYLIASTGNADAFDYEQTTIQIKKSKSSELAQLKKDLSSSYEVASSVSNLAETSSFDAIVIVGAK